MYGAQRKNKEGLVSWVLFWVENIAKKKVTYMGNQISVVLSLEVECELG